MPPETLSVDYFRIVWKPGPFVPRLEGGIFAIVGGMGQRRPGMDTEFIFRRLLNIIERRGPDFMACTRAIYVALRDAGWEVDEDVWEKFFSRLDAERAVRRLVMEDFIIDGGVPDFQQEMRRAQQKVMESEIRSDLPPLPRLDLPPLPRLNRLEKLPAVRRLGDEDVDEIVKPRKVRGSTPRPKKERVPKKPNRRKVVWDD